MAYQDRRIRWVVLTLWESIRKKKKHTNANVLEIHIKLVSIYLKKKEKCIYIHFPFCTIYR